MHAWIRTAHRWIAIAFTLGVMTYIVDMIRGQPPFWVGLFALVPLILLLLSGLYMLVVHYAARLRRPARA